VTSQNERQLLVSNQYDFAASKGSGLTSIDVRVYQLVDRRTVAKSAQGKSGVFLPVI
jgi:hypothetical protein